MREIILSVHPIWLEKMRSGEKIEELRKERPQCGTPFKVYLYRTVDGTDAGGNVVGEYVCDVVHEYSRTERDRLLASARAAISPAELRHYWGRRATLHGWHISKLIFYAQPRPLEDYGLTRAPQSWCYAREVPDL